MINFRRTSVSFLCLLNLAALSFADKPVPQEVAQGIVYYNETQSSGPLSFHVLEIDYKNKANKLETVAADNRLFKGNTLYNIIAAQDDADSVVGGVNGGYWGNGIKYVPTGMLMSNGYLLRLPADGRSVFLLDENRKPYMGPATFSIKLSTGKSSLSIENLNQLSVTNDIALFTPHYGEKIPTYPEQTTFYKMTPQSAGQKRFLPNEPVKLIAEKVEPINVDEVISKDDFLLAVPADKKLPFNIEKAKNLTLEAKIKEVSSVIHQGVGGGPLLLKDGKEALHLEKGKFGSSFITARHPRTAIGASKNGEKIYLVVVDGRQPQQSIGISLKDLSAYMKKIGCDMALNLDGGGSSTLIVNNKVENTPSDVGGPRRVANGILVKQINLNK